MGFFSNLFGGKKEDPALTAALDHIHRIIDDEKYQLELINPVMMEKIKSAPSFDQDPKGTGPFGMSENNPIPVNGPLGELAYLSRIETLRGERLLFHRVGAVNTIDVFEAVTFSGSEWFVFFLDFYPKNQISSAMSLPQNMLSGTAVAPVLLTLDANTDDSVRMIDLSGPVAGGRANPKFGKDLSVQDVMDLYEHGNEKPYLSCNASIQDIEICDYSLMPTRYTRRVADLGEDRVKLGDLLLETVRSPVPTKDGNGVAVWEVGITLLDRWQPIEQHFERHMQLQPKKSEQSLLRDRDIVLSIKGTVGKAGVIGQLAQNINPDPMWSENPGTQNQTPLTNAAVPAASCIALRVNPAKVLPEYLLLFLRSDDFKNQLESLRVGAAIAHITPSSLLNSILVPLPPIEQQSELWESAYLELRELEKQSDQISERMNVIRDGLFRNSN